MRGAMASVTCPYTTDDSSRKLCGRGRYIRELLHPLTFRPLMNRRRPSKLFAQNMKDPIALRNQGGFAVQNRLGQYMLYGLIYEGGIRPLSDQVRKIRGSFNDRLSPNAGPRHAIANRRNGCRKDGNAALLSTFYGQFRKIDANYI